MVELLDNEAGGIKEADTLSALPRDNQQVQSIRCNLFAEKKDEFAVILERCKLNSDESFIQAAPELAGSSYTNLGSSGWLRHTPILTFSLIFCFTLRTLSKY